MGLLFMAHRHLSFILVKKAPSEFVQVNALTFSPVFRSPSSSLSVSLDRQEIHNIAGKQHTFVFIYLHKTKAASNWLEATTERCTAI